MVEPLFDLLKVGIKRHRDEGEPATHFIQFKKRRLEEGDDPVGFAYAHMPNTEQFYGELAHVSAGCGGTTVNEVVSGGKNALFRLFFDVDKATPDFKPFYAVPAIQTALGRYLKKSVNLRAIVLVASSEEKTGYHIHFPGVVVNQDLCKFLYAKVNDEFKFPGAEFDVGAGTSSLPKLRMAFQDKLDRETGDEAGRPYLFHMAIPPMGRELTNLDIINLSSLFPGTEPISLLKHEVNREFRKSIRDFDAIDRAAALRSAVAAINTTHMADESYRPTGKFDLSDKRPFDVAVILRLIHDSAATVADEAIAAALPYINEHFAIIHNKGTIAMKAVNTCTGTTCVQFISDRQFKVMSAAWMFHYHDGKRQHKTNIGRMWLEHPDQQHFNDVEYMPYSIDPGAIPDTVLNTFPGMGYSFRECENAYNCQKASVSRATAAFFMHIWHIWCRCNQENFYMVMNWLAHIVQRPAEKLHVAIGLVGPQRGGKGCVFHLVLKKLLGATNSTIVQRLGDIAGDKNAIGVDKLLLFLDEAFNSKKKDDASFLKSLITEPDVRKRMLYADTVNTRNYANIILASNDDNALTIGEREERWLLLKTMYPWTPETHSHYFENLTTALQEDNDAAAKVIGYILYTFPIANDFRRGHNPPKTRALEANMLCALDSVNTFIYQRLSSGQFGKDIDVNMIHTKHFKKMLEDEAKKCPHKVTRRMTADEKERVERQARRWAGFNRFVIVSDLYQQYRSTTPFNERVNAPVFERRLHMYAAKMAGTEDPVYHNIEMDSDYDRGKLTACTILEMMMLPDFEAAFQTNTGVPVTTNKDQDDIATMLSNARNRTSPQMHIPKKLIPAIPNFYDEETERPTPGATYDPWFYDNGEGTIDWYKEMEEVFLLVDLEGRTTVERQREASAEEEDSDSDDDLMHDSDEEGVRCRCSESDSDCSLSSQASLHLHRRAAIDALWDEADDIERRVEEETGFADMRREEDIPRTPTPSRSRSPSPAQHYNPFFDDEAAED